MPKLCEIFGVEPEEIFFIRDYGRCKIDAKGNMFDANSNVPLWRILTTAIEEPERVKRLPLWTTEEQEDAKMLVLLYPKSKGIQRVKYPSNKNIKLFNNKNNYITNLPSCLFPNLETNSYVLLEDIINYKFQ